MAAPVRSLRRTSLLLALLAASAAGWALASGRIRIPEAWNPWAPLRLDATPNLLTRFKLSRASADPAACRALLAQAEMTLVPVDDRVTGAGCGFQNAVRIERSSVAVGEPFRLSCRAALSLAMWERHALQAAAQAHLGARVTRIEHLGSYACRDIYGQAGRRRSQHATADALDIAGFVLADGRRVRVVEAWRSDGAPVGSAMRGADARAQDAFSPEARFLRAVHEGACPYFDAVLGPEYNRAHADHFHFDRGRARVCR